MKKKMVAWLLAGAAIVSSAQGVWAAPVDETSAIVSENVQTDAENAVEETAEAAEESVAEAATDEVLAAEVVEHVVIDGKKYLLEDDSTYHTGWYTSPEGWKFYCNPEDGNACARGVCEIEGVSYLFNEDCILVESAGTPMVDGKKYWTNQEGIVSSGWLYLGNWKMYFDPDTYQAAVGMLSYNEKMYLFNDDGVMQTKPGTTIIGDGKYWFSDDDASLKTGWLTLGDWKLYFDPVTYKAAIGLKEIDGKMYLFNSDGVLYAKAGTPVIDGVKYWFGSDGSLQTGWLKLGDWKLYFDPETYQGTVGMKEIDEKMYLFNSDGVLYAKAGTPVIDGVKYWFDDDGSLKTGWLKLGDWKLYFDPVTYKGVVGLTEIDGEKYLFDNNGILVEKTGLIVVNEKKYYISEEGRVQTGWQTIGDWTFYFDPETGAAMTGIQAVDGKRRVFDQNGVLVEGSGLCKVGNHKYYFDENGEPVTGWVTIGNWVFYFNPQTAAAAQGIVSIDGKTYYFNDDCIRTQGRQLLNGKTYYFKADGSMYKNEWITFNGERIWINGEGVGITDLSDMYPGPYRLIVDRSNCVITVYAQASDGSWTIPVRAMTCSVGLPDTETPTGTYNTLAKFVLKELMGPSWGKWSTRVTDGIYFHSVATGSASDPTHSVPAGEYNKLGSPASHGCIRLCVRDAKWIYDRCELGTVVIIGDNFSMPLGKPEMTKIWDSVDPTDPEA